MKAQKSNVSFPNFSIHISPLSSQEMCTTIGGSVEKPNTSFEKICDFFKNLFYGN